LLSVAVKTVDVVPPVVQMIGLVATALTVGLSTVTVTLAVAIQLLASVMVTVYVVVAAGVAVGFDTVLELKPDDGLQL